MRIDKRTKDIATSVVLILFAVAGFLYCRQNVFPIEGDIGSFYMPKLLFAVLFVLSVLKLIEAIGEEHEETEKVAIEVDKRKLMTGIGTISLVGAYCLLFRWLGFVIASFLYMVGQMLLFQPQGKKRWGLIFLIATVTTAAAYLIFVVGFNLSMPLGLLKNII